MSFWSFWYWLGLDCTDREKNDGDPNGRSDEDGEGFGDSGAFHVRNRNSQTFPARESKSLYREKYSSPQEAQAPADK